MTIGVADVIRTVFSGVGVFFPLLSCPVSHSQGPTLRVPHTCDHAALRDCQHWPGGQGQLIRYPCSFVHEVVSQIVGTHGCLRAGASGTVDVVGDRSAESLRRGP